MSPEQAGRLARSLLDEVWGEGEREGSPDGSPEGSPVIAPGVRIDGYEILSHVATGGTCEVFRARGDGQDVALKVLKAALPPEIEWRVFEREAAALGRLSHPAIARLVGSGRVTGDRAYLAIEFVEGERLTAHACGSVVEATVEIFAAICDGIDHAHGEGVIHRDLKPSNILVDASGPRIVDFGVSLPAQVQRRCRHAGWSGGTRAYMSPEQVALPPWNLDSRTDVFSLGVILHQLLTGRRPFDVHDLEADEAITRLRAGCAALARGGFLSAATDGSSGRREGRAGELGRATRATRARLTALELVVARALAFDRDLRFQSASELGRACREAAAG